MPGGAGQRCHSFLATSISPSSKQGRQNCELGREEWVDQSPHIPPSSGTSWLRLLQLSVLQVVQVRWWVLGKENPLLASTAVPPVQAMGRWPRSSSDSSLAELGEQQLRQHGDLPGRGHQGRGCLHQTSAQQQPWPNFRLIYKFLCHVTSACARPGVSLFKVKLWRATLGHRLV